MNRATFNSFLFVTMSLGLCGFGSCGKQSSPTTPPPVTPTPVPPSSPIFSQTAVNTWLTNQSLSGTPLVRSYQITPRDSRVPDITQNFLPDFANTYDNSLMGLYSLYSGTPSGIQRAKDILTYYNNGPALPNRSNKEYVVISGELLYVGLLAAQYDERTGDHQFDPMMKRFDAYVLDPNLNLNGSLKGGPDQPWSSTEHNLSALSYLEMRIQMLMERNQPGDVDMAKQLRARQKLIASWLVNSAYISSQGRFRRGDGDDTYATDTSFLGVDVLNNLKKYDTDFYNSSGLSTIDLSGLMRFAENHAMVTNYPYQKPDGTTVSIQGFRYQDQSASPVSFEWTAMAVRAYEDLGETSNANALKKSLQDAMITSSDGSQAWAYAASPGNQFADGSGAYATAYPSVASTIWSTVALSGFPSNWPFSFGKAEAAVPASASATAHVATDTEDAAAEATDNPVFSAVDSAGQAAGTKTLHDVVSNSGVYIISQKSPALYKPLVNGPGQSAQAAATILMATPRPNENYSQIQIRSALSHDVDVVLPTETQK